MDQPFQNESGFVNPKNQIAMLLYVTRVYGKCKPIYRNL